MMTNFVIFYRNHIITFDLQKENAKVFLTWP